MRDLPHYDDSLTIALLRAREVVTARFREHVAQAGLTLPQWRVIRALAGGGDMDTTTLAEHCVILPPSLTRIINHLLAENLVETVPTRDKRQRAIRLTKKGSELFEQVWAISEQRYADIKNRFGEDEIDALVTSLNRLRTVLND